MHNSPETQDLFWDLLNEAEKECGFNVDNSMIYVEATTSGAGNFTLIVTKTNEKPGTLAHSMNRRKNIKLKRKAMSLKSSDNIYEFDTFDDVCEFAKIVENTNLGENSLYRMNEKYYLKILSMPFHHILEYASICPSPSLMEAKINEYGSLIMENNALQTVNLYFNQKNQSSRLKNRKK